MVLIDFEIDRREEREHKLFSAYYTLLRIILIDGWVLFVL